MRTRAFSLLELLVVVAIIGLLMSVLLPALSKSRATARRTVCLVQMRSLELAHWMYMSNNNWHFVDIDDSGHDELSWTTTLSSYYGKPLITRCTTDDSPHWPGGTPLPGGKYRRTSYGINNFLSSLNVAAPYTRLSHVPRPAATVHFVHMATRGNSAGADHGHPDDWWIPANPGAAPTLAAAEMATSAHGGTARTWDAVTNYGFLDGHAETRSFRNVFSTLTNNNFNPAVAH
jgi:prepilin-type N-terminal cleavage/methylation domain-containing protein/prepilin-type processing-associated H-X9-DG protein